MSVRPWFHVMFSTYGTWLRADERGFRDPGHRVHSSGNYKRPPPPDEHANLRRWVKGAMHKLPVRLSEGQRSELGVLLIGELWACDIALLVVAVGAEHVHLLGRFPEAEVRALVGRAKRRSSHAVRDQIPGAVWGKRCRPLHITDHAHQLTVFRYIASHRDEGAWVWTFRDADNAGVGIPYVAGTSARRLEDSSSA